VRLGGALLLLALAPGCASSSTPGPLATADLLDWQRLEAWADPAGVEAAQQSGVAARAVLEPITIAGRDLRRVVAEGLRGGEVRELTLVCERSLGQAERALRPWALVAAPHDGATMAAALDAAGASRGDLHSVIPERRLTAWRTALPGVYRLYERAPGADGQAVLVGVARAPDDRALDDLLPGARRWTAIARRVERAVATGAKLEQLREEVACVEAVPFEEERARVRPIFDVFTRELEQRRAAIEAAWPGADLAVRCKLAREAIDGAAAAQVLDDGRHRALAERLTAEVRAQLLEAADVAERERRDFASAGWRLAAATFAGAESAAVAARGQDLLRARVLALLPALDGPANPGLDGLWTDPPLGLRDALLGRYGLAPSGRAAHRAASTTPAARLEVGRLQGDLKAHTEDRTVVHDYTRPNPEWARWNDAVNEVARQLDAAVATAAATENYTTNETYYEHVHTTDGRFVRTDKKTRLVTNEAKRAAHYQAKAAAEDAQIRLQRLAPLEPPKRLPAQTTYVEHWQVWTGEVGRPVTLTLDGQRAPLPQRQPAPSHRVRTAGFQGSDLREENVPPEDGWTTTEAIAADALRMFDGALPDLVRPLVVEALARRVAKDVEGRVAARPGRDDELAWAHLFFGLPLAADDRARRVGALGVGETP
jgi:hypothetical protein